MPPGVPVPGGTAETVAVKVTVCPRNPRQKLEGFGEEVMEVVVAYGFSEWLYLRLLSRTNRESVERVNRLAINLTSYVQSATPA